MWYNVSKLYNILKLDGYVYFQTGCESMGELLEKCTAAKLAAQKMAQVSTVTKDNALGAIAKALVDRTDEIIAANKRDLENARKNGIREAMIDRLTLTPERIKGIADGVLEVKALADPIGEVTGMWKRPNGLEIGRKRVPGRALKTPAMMLSDGWVKICFPKNCSHAALNRRRFSSESAGGLMFAVLSGTVFGVQVLSCWIGLGVLDVLAGCVAILFAAFFGDSVLPCLVSSEGDWM